jgi:hypothetical protein
LVETGIDRVLFPTSDQVPSAAVPAISVTG